TLCLWRHHSVLPLYSPRPAAPPSLPSFPTRRSSDLIQADPAVATQLIKVANSSLYGGSRPADSLTAAIARLGLERVREIVLAVRSEEHTSELQSRENLVCRLLLEKKKRAPPTPAQVV